MRIRMFMAIILGVCLLATGCATVPAQVEETPQPQAEAPAEADPEEPETETPAPEAAFSPRDLSADARAVLAVLGPTPCTPEQAAAAAALPLARTLAALTELELVGAATPEPGHRYVAAG